MHKIKKESSNALFKHAKAILKFLLPKHQAPKARLYLATQLKKRTAALWARSAMKGDDCGVFI